MKTRCIFAIRGVAVPVMLLLLSSFAVPQEKQRGREQYLCSEPNPANACTADNACGSTSTPCTVEIKRTASDASVTPGIPNAKANMPFCVKAGTKMIWKSPSKNTGFVVDFGPDSPFAQGAIVGGSDRPVPAVAKTKGCYKYSTGACVSGTIYGMCASVETELIITDSK
jgi:hypothetical protein